MAACSAVVRVVLEIDAQAPVARVVIATGAAEGRVTLVGAGVASPARRAKLVAGDAATSAVRRLRGLDLTAVARVMITVREKRVARPERADFARVSEHARSLPVRRQIACAAFARAPDGRIRLLVALADAELLTRRTGRCFADVSERIARGVPKEAARCQRREDWQRDEQGDESCARARHHRERVSAHAPFSIALRFESKIEREVIESIQRARIDRTRITKTP